VKLRREHGRVHTGRGIAARYRILVLLIVRDPPATAGLLIAAGGLGGVLGSAVVGRVSDKLSGTVCSAGVVGAGRDQAYCHRPMTLPSVSVK
jgi:hypothetical protein